MRQLEITGRARSSGAGATSGARRCRATARRWSGRSPWRCATSTRRSSPASIPIAEPFALGHECVAEVLESATRCAASRPATVVVVPFQISCGACAACAAGRHRRTAATVPRGSAYGMQPLGGDVGRRARRRAARAVRRRDARAAARRRSSRPRSPSVADNVADGYRAVAGPLAAAPGRRGAVVGGCGAQRRPLRGRLRAGARRRRAWSTPTPTPAGSSAPRRSAPRPIEVGELAGQARPLPGHRRRLGRPRGPARRAALDRARRHLHERRDLLRADDAAAAAGDVHARLHAAHRPLPRAGADPRGARADRRRAARPGGRDQRGGAASTTPSRRSPSLRRSSSWCHDRVPAHRRLQLRRRPLRGHRAAPHRQLLPLQALPATQRHGRVAQRPSGARHVPDHPGRGCAADVEARGRRREVVLRRLRLAHLRAQPLATPTRSASGWARSTPIRASARASAASSPTPRLGSRSPTTGSRATPRVATVEPEAIRRVVLVP